VLGQDRQGLDVGVEVRLAGDEALRLVLVLGAQLRVLADALLEVEGCAPEPGAVELVGLGVCGWVRVVDVVERVVLLGRYSAAEEAPFFVIVVVGG
jgi:hypothetical protein